MLYSIEKSLEDIVELINVWETKYPYVSYCGSYGDYNGEITIDINVYMFKFKECKVLCRLETECDLQDIIDVIFNKCSCVKNVKVVNYYV